MEQTACRVGWGYLYKPVRTLARMVDLTWLLVGGTNVVMGPRIVWSYNCRIGRRVD